MNGYNARATPSKYDKVGVIKIGPAKAKNVLVLSPGTSAGAAYFVPLAKVLVAQLPGWQVWSVERRENLLEDQKVANHYKHGKVSTQKFFNYYLGWLTDSSVKHHVATPATDADVAFARGWGMKVEVSDLRKVVKSAEKLGGQGRAGRAFARRLDHHGLRHLGLQRHARRQGLVGTGLHRRRFGHDAGIEVRRRAASFRPADELSVALLRRHPLAVRRALRARGRRRRGGGPGQPVRCSRTTQCSRPI